MGISPLWLLVAFVLGAIATPVFILLVLRARPAPSARQRTLFLAMRSAMDDARRLAMADGPPEFLSRIDVLRAVSIEQITGGPDRAQRFLHEALMAIEVLPTLQVSLSDPVRYAWHRVLYRGKDLVLTVLYPAEDEAPGSEGVPR